MKIVYYKYFFQRKLQRYQNNILPVVQNFTSIDSRDFRNSFTAPGGDNLFLFNIKQDIFLFAITKDDEIIKTISANRLSHQDIYNKLNKDERLGFASYIYIGNNFYGIASTFFGPKNSYWTYFINEILRRQNVRDILFGSEPCPTSASKDEALKFSFKGQTYIKLNRDCTLFDQILGLFGRGNHDADTIIIEIKPAPRNQMPKTFDSIMKNVTDEGIEKYVVKAKESLDDIITDFYLIGSGHISDIIRASGEEKICIAIKDRIVSNNLLKEALKEFTNDQAYRKDKISDLLGLHNLGNWNTDI